MAQLLRNLVESAVNRTITQDQLRDCCRTLGASLATVNEVLAEVQQRLHVRFEKSKESDREVEGAVVEGNVEQADEAQLDVQERVEDEAPRPQNHDVVENEARNPTPEELLRKLLNAKVSGLRSLDSGDDLGPLLDFLDEERATTIPASVLAAAPHLASLNAVVTNPHIQKTTQIRQSFVNDKHITPVIDRLLLKYRRDPPSRAIWKDIILDKYVDFEKLFAALEPSFDHNDEIKEFGGGLGLVKTDQYNAKKKISNESEWTRVYHSWASAVKEVYLHRSEELDHYEAIICDIFQSEHSDPGIAIRTDVVMRQKYSHQPFRLDAREYLQIPLLAEVLASVRGRPSPKTVAKRPADSSTGSSYPVKRSVTTCENWNVGQCSDPCPNTRKHGLCCECLEAHRAQDSPDCIAALRKKRGARASYRRRFGGQSGGGS